MIWSKVRPILPLLLLLLIACGPAVAPEGETAVSPDETDAQPEPVAEDEAEPTAEPTEAPMEEAEEMEEMAEETAEIDLFGPINDEEAIDLMYTMTDSAHNAAKEALDRIVAADDERFIGVLIEQYRAAQIGIVRSLTFEEILFALESLSGQAFGYEWDEYIEWYGNTDLTVPPGFTSWKGRLLSRIDPRFAEFLVDSHPSTIRVEEVQWGGVVVDGIPALDNPNMLTADEAEYLDLQDAVFGLFINGEARAYPLRILDWHEMANDVIGGVPVSIAYCTLCGAAVAYDGRASDGTTYTFGSSGFLFRSNKLMYDRQTRTLWNQLTGLPVLGELVATDTTLNVLPIVLTSWEDWKTQHPDTLVVDGDTGFSRDYTAGAAYGDYFSSPATMFPVAQRDDRYAAKDHVYALRFDEAVKAYPLELLYEEQVVNDVVANNSVMLVAAAEEVQVDGVNRRAGEVTYTAGGTVRAYDGGNLTFALGDEANTVIDENGVVWVVTETELVSESGETLERLGGHLAYWFGWYAFYPETELYGQ